jgi:hypothetical protein
MKRTLSLLFVIVAALNSFGQETPVPVEATDPATVNRGTGIQRACSTTLDMNFIHPRKAKTQQEAFDLGFCLGLIKGVYENLNSKVDFCPANDGVPLRKTAELVVSFVAAHPDLKDKDSADIVRWALTDAFPCPSKDLGSDTHASAKP